MPPRASVIMPNLDCSFAGQAVGSLLEQARDLDLEIIVVGGDKPGVVPRQSRVQLVETPAPVPPATARNIGVEQAAADRLLFLDADCTADRRWASRLLDALDTAPVVGGAVRFRLDGNRWAVADNIASFADLLEDRPDETCPELPLGSLNLGVTRDAWEQVGPFDSRLVTSEDHDWYFRALAAGIVARFERRVVVAHQQVRTTRRQLIEHARWYGRHFHTFRARHPAVFGSGPTWRSRRRLALAAPAKAVSSAVSIFLRHRRLRPAWRCLPAVALFKHTWYRSVIEAWPEQ